jgi:hypothetical protein
MLTIRTLAFLAICSLFIISCKKDNGNGQNAGGTSIYTFAGAPSGCAAPVIAGTYGVGTPLTSANTITLTVDVAVKGTYSFNTTPANGVYFSGSGAFANTGVQTIVLTGNGTPIRSGTFYFVPNTNNTCNFSVSFGAGAPPAVFTYAGAPANCTAPNVSGVYTTGVGLGSNNYVDLAVNVTTAGAYTIITNNVNGMSFSGNGVFTATGAQVVRLIGNGTPAAAGSFAFTPSSNGCSFNITVTPPAPPATFTYDGAPGNCVAPVINGTYAAGTALNGTNTIVLKVNVSVSGSWNVTTNNSNGVVFSGSGVFASTGPNTITLSSTSTPAATGTFSYTPTNNGCSFDITYTGAPPPGDFLTCKVNGVYKDFSDGLMGLMIQTGPPYSFGVSGTLVGGSDQFGVQLQDNNPIAMGAYRNFTLSNMTKFCAISSNFSSVLWNSSITSSNTFIVTVTLLTPTIITGDFSGTIYENGFGPATKSITEGKFRFTY